MRYIGRHRFSGSETLVNLVRTSFHTLVNNIVYVNIRSWFAGCYRGLQKVPVTDREKTSKCIININLPKRLF